MVSAVASGDVWSFGSGAFQFEGLPGYLYARGVTPAYYLGPNGEAAIVSVFMASQPHTTVESSAQILRLVERFKVILSGAEARYGKAAWPVKEEALPDGQVRLSLPVQISGPRGPEFLLQFAFISPKADAAILTVEGPGDAIEAWGKFRTHAESARWQDAR